MKQVALIIVIALLVLAGCGAKVEVPPAHVGKILTKNGYAPETIPPSKFRLPPCFAYCDKLVLLEASDQGFQEVMKVFMPKDKLNLTVEVRGTLSIPTGEKNVNAIYDRIVSQDTDDGDVSKITLHHVYSTYGEQALRGVVRNEITKYTIGDILENREGVGQNVHAAVTEKMSDTSIPIQVSRFELADIQPPQVIVAAQQAAKEREIDIQKAQADAEVEMVKAERELEVAKKERAVERERALAIADANRIAAKSVTPELLAYKRLETAERIYTELAGSENVVIVPADASGFSNINDDAVLAKLLGRELR